MNAPITAFGYELTCGKVFMLLAPLSGTNCILDHCFAGKALHRSASFSLRRLPRMQLNCGTSTVEPMPKRPSKLLGVARHGTAPSHVVLE